MASQESTLDPEGVTVYFVIPSKYASDKECSDDMWLAYNVSKHYIIFLNINIIHFYTNFQFHY